MALLFTFFCQAGHPLKHVKAQNQNDSKTTKIYFIYVAAQLLEILAQYTVTS